MAGEKLRAQECIRKGLNFLEKFDIEHDAMVFASLIHSLFQIGEREEAESLLQEASKKIEGISNDYLKTKVLCYIAMALNEVKEKEKANKYIKEALQMVNESKEPSLPSVSALEFLILSIFEVCEQKKTEDYIEKIFKTTVGLKDDSRKIEAFTILASSMSEFGKIDKLKSYLQKIISMTRETYKDWKKSNYISKITIYFQNIHKIEGIEKFLQELYEIADGIDNEIFRSQAFSWISALMARAGKFSDAKKIAEKIHNGFNKSTAISEILLAMVRAGEIEETLKLLSEINNLMNKSEVLSIIATRLDQAGESDRARKYFQEALETSEGIKNDNGKSRALAKIAQNILKTNSYILFDHFLRKIKMPKSCWEVIIPHWQIQLIETIENPLPYLRNSVSFYPFDIDIGYQSVFSFLKFYAASGNWEMFKRIIKVCSQLKMDNLFNDVNP